MPEMSKLAEAIAHCREDQAKALVEEKIRSGAAATEIVAECNQGMIELGNRFASSDCFLPDLMFGGMIMKRLMGELGAQLESAEKSVPQATAVIGTVQYDVHDIGKDIVVMMLRGAGFEVVDLGVDAPPEKFLDAIRQAKPAVVGISVLLTTCFKSVTHTVEAIRQAGLRDNVSIMVGGAAASQLLSDKAGCDFYGKTAVDGLKYASKVAGVG
jgi:5-methyltetrahydrofolate--homocysteine methyltransferase